MSALTKIQWATHTYNPWRGCRKVAPECANCYITSTPPFRMTGQKHGAARVRAGMKALAEPLRWNRAAETLRECHRCGHVGRMITGCHKCGTVADFRLVRPRVFCLSLGDWLDDENVPIEWLAELLTMIYAAANLDWLLLTKRPQNFMERLNAAAKVPGLRGYELIEDWQAGEAPENVWIGVSAGADQEAALAIPARVHFLSCEPMLGPMDTTHAAGFDWIIFGGESGPKARPCDVDWIRQGLAFCREENIAAFVKQLGGHAYDGTLTDEDAGIFTKDKKGGDPAEWPPELRVREFPNLNPQPR